MQRGSASLVVTLSLAAASGSAGLVLRHPSGVIHGLARDLHARPRAARSSIYMTSGGVLPRAAVLVYLRQRPLASRLVDAAGAAVTLAALAFTYSRNAWLGRRRALGLVQRRGRSLRIVAVLATLLTLGAVTMPGPVNERARSIANLEDRTLQDRVAMWRSGLSMIADHAFLGVGPGEVRTWYQHYRRPEAVRPSTGHLHNSAIQIAAERGLPALVAWLWLWIVFFREGWAILGGPTESVRARWCARAQPASLIPGRGLFEHNFGDGEVVMVAPALMAQP
jgi:O-antigen ligase